VKEEMMEHTGIYLVGIDHLVVAAKSLEEGIDYLERTLGVKPKGGGEHSTMGTHNRLLRLGYDCYLEMIAINPKAPKPAHPRWFELDDDAMRESLQAKPRLVAWALRTDRIEDLAQRSEYPLGRVKPMSRGDLNWRLTLTEDGRLQEGGCIPFLIQWDRSPHPASTMAESGLRLASLYGRHPQPEIIRHAIRSLGADRLFEVKEAMPGSPPSLAAIIETPRGLIELA
jgi:hypothetical protein